MEPIVHYLIPVIFVLFLFPKLNKKLIFSLGTLTWIMDLSFYTPFHRALTHTLIFMIVVSLLLYWIINKEAMLLSFYFIGSHLILDSGFPGSALLWPFYEKAFYMTTELTTDFLLNIKFGVTDLTLRPDIVHHFFTTDSILLLVLLALLLCIKHKDKIRDIVFQYNAK